MRRVNPEIDGQVGDALVGSCDAIRLILDLFSEEKNASHALLAQAHFVNTKVHYVAERISTILMNAKKCLTTTL